jgi:hypothetical protein
VRDAPPADHERERARFAGVLQLAEKVRCPRCALARACNCTQLSLRLPTPRCAGLPGRSALRHARGSADAPR